MEYNQSLMDDRISHDIWANPRPKSIIDLIDPTFRKAAAQPLASYLLPTRMVGVLGNKLIVGWNDIVVDVRELHNDFVGMPCCDVGTALRRDVRLQDIEQRLVTWSNLYIDRMLRNLPSTDISIASRLATVIGEVVPLIEDMAWRADSANHVFFQHLLRYLPAKMYQSIISNGDCDADSTPPSLLLLANSVDEAAIKQVSDSARTTGSVARLRELADGIESLRLFLQQRFPIVQLPQLALPFELQFSWAPDANLGYVVSCTAVRENDFNNNAQATFVIDADGLLESCMIFQANSFSVAQRGQIDKLNLYLLRSIYSQLCRLYCEVEKGLTSGSCKMSTAEKFALSCSKIAEQYLSSEYELSGSKFKPSGISFERLMTILTIKLGCRLDFVGPHKLALLQRGDEYFKIGHQDRASLLQFDYVRILLSRLKISYEEWIEAAH